MRARVMNGFWVFQAPTGYRYERVSGGGRMLKRDEPAASVVQEALEGYASGRFETQADVMRFLQEHPLFPKDSRGRIRHQRIHVLLNQPVYAGYVEAPEWDVSLRVGQHEPLISFQTYQRIQDRLKGIGRAPMRKNLNQDFPLRGFVACADCGAPLTACWSKGSHSLHPYYLCPKRGCPSYGKSIRRDRIEGEFETLLHAMTPSAALFKVATAMFKDLWDHRSRQGEAELKALSAQLVKIEGQVEQLLERILDARVPSVIAAYEERVRKLEEDKLLIRERMANAGRPKSSFDGTLRTALEFLSSPWKLWNSDRLEDKRAVLKLTFADRLRYTRNEGFRTTDLSLPFKLLDALNHPESRMASPRGFEPLLPP
ncbi:MAG: recombinase zinc beta ribbon domain-containing protein [Niveispirillum sp.]|nr:recombinase zinc beta ribbon domain-containing protein [Niveispirillum sp.]